MDGKFWKIKINDGGIEEQTCVEVEGIEESLWREGDRKWVESGGMLYIGWKGKVTHELCYLLSSQ